MGRFKRANMIVDRSADEHEPGAGRRRPSQIRQTRNRKPFYLYLAERNMPLDFSGIGAHGHQLAKGRRGARYARWRVKEFARHRERRAVLFGDLGTRMAP